MATTIIGSLAINDFLAIQSRPAGQVSWGPINVPSGYSRLTIQIDLQQVSSLTPIFTASADLSLDGVNFTSLGGPELNLAASGYRLVNGVLTRAVDDPLGTGPVRTFGFQFPLFSTELTTRKVRGTLSCSESVISGATFVAF